MRRALPGLVPVLCFSLLSVVVSARAQEPDDEVDLVDGTVLHGRVIDQVPGSYVVIQTPDGRSQSVPWTQVKRVATAAAPLPTRPPPAAPPPVAPAPARVPEAPAAATEGVRAPAVVHFEAGVRLGYSFSNGDYFSGAQMGSASSSSAMPGVSGSVPFVLDLGLRMGAYVFVGGFVQYALLDTSCFTDPGVNLSCSGHDIRGGAEIIAHLMPRAKTDPWIGLGLGHEWLELDMSASASGASAQLTETFDGWNFADLMLGVDFHLGASGAGAIGPYFELTSGSYTSVSVSGSNGAGGTTSTSGDVNGQSSHQWFTLGVRGTYEFL